MLDSATRFLECVQEVCDDVDTHAAAVSDHQHRVANCERNLVEHAGTEADLQVIAASHERDGDLHAEVLQHHQRLEQTRHKLMARLALDQPHV